ncbi:hypothetical protein BH24DEI2_BH24DEI2_05170 [soil metagenome]
MTKKRLLVLCLLILAIGLGGCRNETQNRIRRSIQDFTADKLYINVYSWDGKEIFTGIVDGKVTRSSAKLSNTGETAEGSYVYWFDDKGRYHQTDLPYLVTSYDRDETVRAP